MTTLERVLNLTPVDRQVNQLQPRQEKTPSQPKSIKGWWNRFFVTLLLAGHLYGCSGVVQARPDPEFLTEAAATATSTYLPPQETPESSTPLPTVTKTKVPTPTRKATETQAPTPTKTETPEKYPIDIEKLHNFPESYEYMVNNLNEFVEFPDPFVDPDGFNASVEKLKTIIGDSSQREKNYIGSIGDESDFYVADAFLSPNQLEGQPEIAYFKHQGVVYPMIGLNVYGTDSVPGMGSTRTLLVILYNGRGAPEGTDVIQTLSNGGHIRSVYLIKTEWSNYPDFVNGAIQAGIVPVDDSTYDQIIYGIGGIQTEEGRSQ